MSSPNLSPVPFCKDVIVSLANNINNKNQNTCYCFRHYHKHSHAHTLTHHTNRTFMEYKKFHPICLFFFWCFFVCDLEILQSINILGFSSLNFLKSKWNAHVEMTGQSCYHLNHCLLHICVYRRLFERKFNNWHIENGLKVFTLCYSLAHSIVWFECWCRWIFCNFLFVFVLIFSSFLLLWFFFYNLSKWFRVLFKMYTENHSYPKHTHTTQ